MAIVRSGHPVDLQSRSEMYAVVDDAEEDLPDGKAFLFDLTLQMKKILMNTSAYTAVGKNVSGTYLRWHQVLIRWLSVKARS